LLRAQETGRYVSTHVAGELVQAARVIPEPAEWQIAQAASAAHSGVRLKRILHRGSCFEWTADVSEFASLNQAPANSCCPETWLKSTRVSRSCVSQARM